MRFIIFLMVLLPLVSFSQKKKDRIFSKSWYCELDVSKISINDTVYLKDNDSGFRNKKGITRFFSSGKRKFRRVIMAAAAGQIVCAAFYLPEKWSTHKHNKELVLSMSRKGFFEKYLIIYHDFANLTLVLMERHRAYCYNR